MTATVMSIEVSYRPGNIGKPIIIGRGSSQDREYRHVEELPM